MKHTLYAIAAVLLFSAAMLSLVGWAAKQPMKRYFYAGATREHRSTRSRPTPPTAPRRRRAQRVERIRGG